LRGVIGPLVTPALPVVRSTVTTEFSCRLPLPGALGSGRCIIRLTSEFCDFAIDRDTLFLELAEPGLKGY
jgi:hypothetical protein